MKAERGFTLISVMIAIIMMSIAIAGIAGTITTVSAAQTESATRSTAHAIARGAMETVRSRDAKVLLSEPELVVNDEGKADPTGRFTREVEVDEVSRQLRSVTVRVTYPRARKPVELVTLTYVGAFGR